MKKNKLLLCFRPVGFEREAESKESDRSEDMSLACNMVSKNTIKSPNSDKRLQTRKKNAIASSSEAATFDISMRKKSRNRKASQLTIDSKSTSNGPNGYSSASDAFSEITTTDSSASSSPTSCSSSNSSPTPKNKKGSNALSISVIQRKENAGKVNGISGSSAGLFLLLMCLAMTMFYGRVYAVIFTTPCLYFLSRRSNGEFVPPESMGRPSPETELSAREYRKRVIMEGLLQRNHQRRLRGH